MSRTVLVKPLASMLRIHPEIYEPGVTCEEVYIIPASCGPHVIWSLSGEAPSKTSFATLVLLDQSRHISCNTHTCSQ